jgi:hypothetical protein
LNGAIKKITTKPTTPNGRVNEECVLLGAFWWRTYMCLVAMMYPTS